MARKIEWGLSCCVVFAIAAGCGGDITYLRCGPGTVKEGRRCVPEEDTDTSGPSATVGASTGTTTGGSGGGSTGGTGAGGSPTPSELIPVDIEAQHVIADPARGVFYATVAGDAPAYGNSLVVVDAASATVTDSVFVGSQPSTMALSDDASTLWVSLQGSYEIRKVDLTSGSPVPAEEYVLPPTEWNDLAHAGPMVVLPGTTDSVALSLHYVGLSPSYAGSVIIDAGVARPKMTPGHTGASQLTGGPPGWVFGFNNLHTGFGFYSLQISPDGLTSTEHEDLVSGFYTDIVYTGERVYATSGEVVDVSIPAAPKKAGQFAFGGQAVLPLGKEPRLLMLSADFSDPVTLRFLDTKTFTQISSVSYPELDVDSVHDLVSPDGAILAFIATNSFDKPPRVYLLKNPFGG